MRLSDRLRQERMHHHWSQEALAEALGVSARCINCWEQGQAIPQAATRLKMSRLFGVRPEELFEDQETRLSPTPPYWGVSSPRNPFFTGREEILQALHTSLDAAQKGAFLQSYALQGLGGVGKTQVALEYAYRSALDYRAVLWIEAATMDSMRLSLLRLAEILQLPERDEKDQQGVIRAVHTWLMTHDQWLLICDNVEELGMLDQLLPPVRHGAILFTTRLQTLGTRARSIALRPMESEEGMLLLLRRAKVVALEATSEQVRQLALPQYAAAMELVTTLGGLPLALDQAGAYLEETHCSLSTYLDLLGTRRAALLQQRGAGASDHPASVSTTFTLLITATTQRHPAVLDLLRICALLQPDAIPEELFRQGSEHLGATLEVVCGDVLDWNRLVAAACSSSLLSRQPEAQVFSIHRLVQTVLLDAMTQDEREVWAWRVIGALDAVFPDLQPNTGYASWKRQCERLLPHALLSLDGLGGTADALSLASLAYKVAQYLRECGQYAEAEPLLRQALSVREHVLGPVHPLVAELLNYLAELYWRQGRYAEAEPLYQRALLPDVQGLESEDSRVAESLNSLALLYWRQGKYVEAEPLYQRALQIREQAKDPLVSVPLNHLGLLYCSLGKYVEAEPLYQRALHIWEQAEGPEHLYVTYPLNNLAELYRAQGKYMQAEPLYQRALRIREQALGPEHPDVATLFHNLAELYRAQGKYMQAEVLYQRALFLREKSLGPEHPLVADSLNGLANLYRNQNKDTEARALYQRALSIREQQLGHDHPETAQTLHDLAIFSQQRGDLDEVRSLAQRALRIRSQSLGDDHPQTVITRSFYTQLGER